MKINRTVRFLPLLIFIGLVLGVLIGTFFTSRFLGGKLNVINASTNKLSEMLYMVNSSYVDTVNVAEMVEDVIPKMLEGLDPHSSYIKAEDVERSNEDLKGSFSGIGVQFTQKDDTVHITNVIKGGPSEKVGILAGDRIVTVDGESYVGKIVNNDETMRRLKGEKGSSVVVGIVRHGHPKPIEFTIVRGDIPLKSIDATYMLTEALGYVKINKIGETTYQELLMSLAMLQEKGFSGLVMDLRGNGGGYLGAAINMINEFLPGNKLIVYTEGRAVRRDNYFSDGRGSYQKLPLIILTDESTASAAEIISGAVQDNDRGVIVGRRTFGKGLVQQPIEFDDGSMIHLTVSRYYTPSGRCIQKPYVKGKKDEYNMDIVSRFEHGEFFNEDSIKLGDEKYTTSIGRTVYGGGGIMPDYFVAEDTADITNYYTETISKGYVTQFCYDYADRHRQQLSQFTNANELEIYLRKNNVLEQFIRFADDKGVKRRNNMIKKSRKIFEQAIYGTIIYYMLEMGDYIEYINKYDNVVNKAIEIFNNGNTFPSYNEVTVHE
jgi:carboxyl-terminal processing protease